MLKLVDDKIDFSKEERKILDYWENAKIFEKIQVARKLSYESKECNVFSLYDGPPFATGLPHYGHILTGTIKDIIARFATQSNCYVERSFGWDCHGLPVEYEVDRRLGISEANEVHQMGIASYNDECRKIVMRYAIEWKEMVRRTGRWVDFEHDYKTMYAWYMESVWWVFSQLYAKGLVYRGTKVMPYSVGCQTPLSNFEAGQNYKAVVDVALTVCFHVASDNVFRKDKLLIWTTTPWTLPANLAVCVNPKIDYVRLQDHANGNTYILAKGLAKKVFPEYAQPSRYEILEEFKGRRLKDLKYKPPFKYYEGKAISRHAFRVLLDEYVTENAGTGIVHLSPFFGEDDYRICTTHGIVIKTHAMACPLDDHGVFTKEIPDLKGIFYKDANPIVTNKLTQMNLLISNSRIEHSLPFCWRSDTPLIYKSVLSWFVRVEQLVENLLLNNAQTNWIPEQVQEKRFTNWLRSARDWAISRNRYWGTPIPIWTSETGDEIVCIGSLAELQEKTGVTNIRDLHREFIDQLKIPSAVPGRAPLRRISEVFDCWFESGAMPFAQQHYPFENSAQFYATFPADIIAEGIDQTRGWFYTLLVISTALYNSPPYRNVIVSGLVLAADGQKMSKRKQNYPDPMDIVNRYGADALRLYLINSPLVRAGCLNFKEEGVRNMLKSVLLPWFHALRLLLQNIKQLESYANKRFIFRDKALKTATHADILNRWILSRNENFVQFIKEHISKYQLHAVVPKLMEHIEELTNWYVRLKRSQMKGYEDIDTSRQTLSVVFYVLLTMGTTVAALVPFFAECVYQQLSIYLSTNLKINSVHYCLFPSARGLINTEVEQQFNRFRTIVELSRKLRDRKTVPLKCPIKELVVLNASKQCLNDLRQLECVLRQELNCKKLDFSEDYRKFGVRLRVKPNFKMLGTRFRSELPAILAAINALSYDDIEQALVSNEIIVLSHKIRIAEEVYIMYEIDSATSPSHYEFAHEQDIMIAIDFACTLDMLAERVIREIISRIQQLKKTAKLLPTDAVIVYYDLEHGSYEMQQMVSKNADIIAGAIKSEFCIISDAFERHDIIAEQVVDINTCLFKIAICKL